MEHNSYTYECLLSTLLILQWIQNKLLQISHIGTAVHIPVIVVWMETGAPKEDPC